MRSPERIVLLHYEPRRAKKYMFAEKTRRFLHSPQSKCVRKSSTWRKKCTGHARQRHMRFWNLSNNFNKRNFQLARKVTCLMIGPTVTRFERL